MIFQLKKIVMDIIPVSRPSIGVEELVAVQSVFDSGWLGLGAQVFDFEHELAKFLGAKNVICTNTGTNALHLALDTLGVSRGDEVLVPSETFVASVQAISATGAVPVFCDINENDLNISIDEISAKITQKTKVIMPVHYRGFPCEMSSIHKIAQEHDIRVLEDAAHAFGSAYHGKKIGSFGDIACFSFDPIKNITCGEGGAVVFQDDDLLERMQQKRILGIDKDTWKRYHNERSWFYDVVAQGYRYHMSNINAAIGLVQLQKFHTMNARKIEVARCYDKVFKEIKGDLVLLENHGYHEIGLFTYILRVRAELRDQLMEYLSERQVGSGIHYIPAHHFTYYQDKEIHLPITDRVSEEILTLPLFADITDEQVEHVTDSVISGIDTLNKHESS